MLWMGGTGPYRLHRFGGDAVVDLATLGAGSPEGFSGFLGSGQWFDLLRRLRLSVFDHACRLSSGSLANVWTQRKIPAGVVGELALHTVIKLFETIHMHVLVLVRARDASIEFGHGSVAAQSSTNEMTRVARLACQIGGLVCVNDGRELSPELLARLNPRRTVTMELCDVDVTFSIRVQHPNHVNVEEGIALIQCLNSVLKLFSRFRHRAVLLVDGEEQWRKGVRHGNC